MQTTTAVGYSLTTKIGDASQHWRTQKTALTGPSRIWESLIFTKKKTLKCSAEVRCEVHEGVLDIKVTSRNILDVPRIISARFPCSL